MARILGRPSPMPVLPPEPLAGSACRLPRASLPFGAAIMDMGQAFLSSFPSARKAVTAYVLTRSARVAAKLLHDSGADAHGYTLHVCEAFRRRKERRPFPAQVWGPKAIERWLPEYRRSVPSRATGEASEERQREYAERMGFDRLPRPRGR